jgi:hypothetical protein
MLFVGGMPPPCSRSVGGHLAWLAIRGAAKCGTFCLSAAQSGYFAASFDSALGLGLGPRLAGRGFEARDSVVGRLGFSSVDGGARTGGRTFPADGDGALPLPLGLGNLDREVAEVTREVTDTVLFKTNAQAR